MQKYIAPLVFDAFQHKNKLNFYEIYFMIIWTSYSRITHKIKYIFTLMLGNKDKITFGEFWFVFQNTISGLKKMFKNKIKTKWDLMELAAKKAFDSADIWVNNTLTLEDIRLWIKFNVDFELFLHEFDCPKYYNVPSLVFKPFIYKTNFEYFDRQTLNTQNIKKNIIKSLSMNFRRSVTRSLSSDMLWDLNTDVKPQRKFEVKQANALLKKNNVKFDYPSSSSESEISDDSFDSLIKDPVIKKFLLTKGGNI